MRKALLLLASCIGIALVLTLTGVAPFFATSEEDLKKWGPNDRNRPEPPIITPGTFSTQDQPGRPPSDAVVLFEGKDLSKWEMAKDGGPPKWTLGNGYFATVPGTGFLRTKQAFGDCQLHIEWAAPDPPHGTDQDRGNSGVYMQGLYEIQVLDSYNNVTYADGQAAAVYGQYPPLVTACRKPGEWQTYDVVFHGPRFDANGNVVRKTNITLFFNGVLVQDHVDLTGPTDHHARPPYKVTPEKLPLALQDHNHPVRYRNVWIRELKEGE